MLELFSYKEGVVSCWTMMSYRWTITFLTKCVLFLLKGVRRKFNQIKDYHIKWKLPGLFIYCLISYKRFPLTNINDKCLLYMTAKCKSDSCSPFVCSLQRLWFLLDQHHTPPIVGEDQMINYEDFLKVGEEAGPKCKWVC